MANFDLQAYGADRVVVGVRNTVIRKKLFQINFKSKDGSLFVNVPYAKLGAGRVGVVELPVGSPESIIFGPTAPLTTHGVKYTHHPDGEAHFSMDGKVLTSVRRRAVPLATANGHLFTLMIQGLHHFADFDGRDIATGKRGVVSMPIADGPVNALKFVAHLHSSEEFAARLQKTHMKSALMPVQLPGGRRLVAVVLATRLFKDGAPYLLTVSVEELQTISVERDLFVSLLGGFDTPRIACDHALTTSFLMMMYPEEGDLSATLRAVGSIDYSKKTP